MTDYSKETYTALLDVLDRSPWEASNMQTRKPWFCVYCGVTSEGGLGADRAVHIHDRACSWRVARVALPELFAHIGKLESLVRFLIDSDEMAITLAGESGWVTINDEERVIPKDLESVLVEVVG